MQQGIPLRWWIGLGLSLSWLCLATACREPAAQSTSPAIAGDANRGEELHNTYCFGCHKADPNQAVLGPSLDRLATRSETTIAAETYTGQAETVPDYLRESILDPSAYVVPGYADGLMPVYENVLSSEDIADLIAYLLTYQ